MALLLAPYNDAMRLGMGFNSFTQQLCVNDAVQKQGGVPATEADLRLQELRDQAGRPSIQNRESASPGALTASDGTQKTQKELEVEKRKKWLSGIFTRTHEDGSQAEISQIVTWKSTFVNNISEVTENMDIKGSLAIKIDAIGGGAKAQANYLNTEAFKKSDLNYHLQVNVVNQKLIGDQINEFMPIKNVQPSQFQDVYGDCYISGFLEGGIFNAVISIEFEDKSKVKEFGGSLAINAKFAGGAVSVEGEGAGSKKSKETSTNDKVTISVSWSGGGDIITEEVIKQGWTMDSLKSVAMAFADKVAICPQRTSAILTKYSSLRSFYEKNVHGSPLDYENAGVYTAALLDAYMDFKMAWKELQTMSKEVGAARMILKKQKDQPELKSIAEAAKTNYDDNIKAYNLSIQPDHNDGALTWNNSNSRGGVRKKPIEKPLPPNGMVPYEDTVFGLDIAARDCRFEMIKIVREVDAVAENPQVAVDPTRNNQYLSPVLFRKLMPATEIVDPVQMQKDLLQYEKDLQETKAAHDKVKSDNVALGEKVAILEADIVAKEATIKTMRANLAELEASIKKAQGEQGLVQLKEQQITELQTKVSDVEGKLTSKDSELSNTILQTDAIRSERDNLKSSVTSKQSEIDSKQAEITRIQTESDRIAAEYKTFKDSRDVSKLERLQKPLRAPSTFLAGGSELPGDLQRSYNTHVGKADKLRMSPVVGDPNINSNPPTFNDLDRIDETWVILKLEIYFTSRYIRGYKTLYTNGQTIMRGNTGDYTDTTALGALLSDGRRNDLVEVHIKCSKESPWNLPVMTWIEMYPVEGASARAQPSERNKSGDITMYIHPPALGWSVRGFWGQVGDAFDRFGVIWGKDN